MCISVVNESSKLGSVNRVYEIREKSHSLLHRPRIVKHMTVGTLCLKVQ